MKLAPLFAAALLIASLSAPMGASADEPASQPAAQQAKEPIDYKKLKDLLPETVAGLKRSNAEGMKQGMSGMKFSKAEGTYSEEGREGSATVTITDFGGMPGMIEGMAAWSGLDIDNESDTQISKTLEVAGHKAYAELNKETKSGQISLVVGGRFVVEIRIDANIADIAALKTEAEAMSLNNLEALAK